MKARAHLTATLITAVAIVPYAITDERGALVLGGVMASLAINPDLDQSGSTPWRLYWQPYATLHKHRGSSHWPVTGTAVRALYLWWWFFILAILGGWNIEWSLWAFIGLVISDAVHIALDGVDKWL